MSPAPEGLLQALREALSGGDEVVAVESCKWFNVIAAFLFQELRDTQRVKRSVGTSDVELSLELPFS